MINDTQSTQISQKQNRRNIHAIIKTMCPLGYHHNSFLVTHALGNMMNNVATIHRVSQCIICNRAIVVTVRAHCFYDCINIYLEKIINKNPDPVKTELYSLKLYWKFTPTPAFLQLWFIAPFLISFFFIKIIFSVFFSSFLVLLLSV